MKNSEIRNQLENYKIHRKLTRDLLLSLSQEQLSIKPFSVSGTFSKQSRHLIDIERCYVESLKTGSPTFFRPSVDHSIENDKKKLIQEMDTLDKDLEQTFASIQWKKTNDKSIDCSQKAEYLGGNNKLASQSTYFHG